MIIGFRHIGIVVKDLEKSLHFYQKILGLTVSKDMNEEGEFIDALLGLAGTKVRTIKMNTPQGCVVELLYYQVPPMPEGSLRRINEQGITHFALTVENLDQEYNRLCQEGVNFIAPPRKSPNGYAKVAFCKDPEGNYIELVEVI